MPSFESHLDLNQNQLIKAVLQPFTVFPNVPSPVPGQIAYNANIGEQRPYFYNGSQWLPFNYIPPGSLTNNLWSTNPLHRLAFEKLATPVTDFDFGSVRLLNLGNPIAAGDATNKAYVDSLIQSFDVKASVRVATVTSLPASTYNNGSGTITGNTNGSLNVHGIDGVTDLAVGNRVLVKNQANQVENGIYVITQLGSTTTPFILTRASDADQGYKLTPGSTVYVEEGAVNQSRQFTLVTPGVITLGSSNLVFQQTSGLGQVNAGLGLTKTGDTLDVNVTGSSTVTVINDSLRVKSSVSQNQVLISTGNATTEAVWGSLPLDQPGSVTGALPINFGGTGASTSAAAFNNLAPSNASGQLIWFNGTTHLPVPANTTSSLRFLSQVSSGQPTWQTLTPQLITTNHTPTNYTPSSNTLQDHLLAIDAAIGVALVSGGITRLIDDPTPTLGGNLNTNNFSITSPTNADVVISPSGTGRTRIGGLSRHLNFDDNSANNIEVNALGTDANININLKPKGTGSIKLNSVFWPTNPGSPGQVLVRQGTDQTVFATLTANQIAANRTAINYSPMSSDLRSHLDAIDIVLGNVSNSSFLLENDKNPTLGGNLKLNDFNIVLKETGINSIEFSQNSQLHFSRQSHGSIIIRPTPVGFELLPFRSVNPIFGNPNDPQFTAVFEALCTLDIRSRNRFQRVRIEGFALPLGDGLPGQVLATNGIGELYFTSVSGSSAVFNNIGTFSKDINTATSTVTINHPFQTQNLVVTVMRTDNFRIVYPEIIYNSVDSIQVIFSQVPTPGLYRVIIQAVATVSLRRFFFDINDTVNSSIVINHNLGTRDVAVDIFQRIPVYRRVFAQVEATTVNSVTVTFSAPPGNNIYRVMVTG